MSYSAIAKLATRAERKAVAIAEDDVVFPRHFIFSMSIVKEYLNSLGDDWDVFSGLIADLHSETKIISANPFGGIQFVTINKWSARYSTSRLFS